VERSVVEVELANGVVALVQVADVEQGGASKTGPLGKFDLGAVAGTLEGLSTTIRAALAKAAPDKVTVEFGLQLAVTSGTLTGLLVDGESSGSLNVTLEWGSGDRK
jgi:Na+/H+-translocating membrane pyrophosphatase